MEIKETREMVQFVAGLIKAIKLANGDGKFSWADSVHFMSLMPLAGKAIGGMGEIKGELKDIDADELKELKQIVMAELEVSEGVDKIVDLSIMIALQIVEIVKASKVAA